MLIACRAEQHDRIIVIRYAFRPSARGSATVPHSAQRRLLVGIASSSTT